MKKLSELGISQTPWEAVYDSKNDEESPYRIDVPPCYSLDGQFNEAEAKLIAAAPELYDAAERYIRFHDESCIHGDRPASEVFADCRKAYQDLKAALAKAGGEEVSNEQV